MIADLLEYYYEVYEPRANYEIVRSIVVDGHESAWCAYSGELIGGEDGERFSTHVWVCECDFTEGVGWYVEDGRRFTKDGPRHCLPRKAALRLVQLELHEEYMGRFGKGEFGTSTYELRAHLGEIVADLAGRVEAGECIGEDGTGAAFWGGWFYLGTLAAITDSFVGHLWDPVAKLVEQGKVGLGGGSNYAVPSTARSPGLGGVSADRAGRVCRGCIPAWVPRDVQSLEARSIRRERRAGVPVDPGTGIGP